MPTTAPARSANSSRASFASGPSCANWPASGADATSSAPKVYCRMLQVKRKKAYTKMPVSSASLMSNTSVLVFTANGSPSTSALVCSLAPSAASRPPMIRMVVEAKNDGLDNSAWLTAPSSTRISR